MDGTFRRCGAHKVRLPDGSVLNQAIVEMEDGRVVNYYEFSSERPMTEWLGGEIAVERDVCGILRAHWQGGRLCERQNAEENRKL